MPDWTRIAKIKIFKDRLQSWAGVLSFMMMCYVFLKSLYASDSLNIIHSWISVLSVPLLRNLIVFVPFVMLILVTIVDVKYILPAEQSWYFQNNPEWRDRNKK
jgi:hypothetical protein